jgi:hypothetical protein
MGEKIGAEKHSAISRAIARFQERVKSDARLRTLLREASSTLSYVQSDPFYVYVPFMCADLCLRGRLSLWRSLEPLPTIVPRPSVSLRRPSPGIPNPLYNPHRTR